MRINCTSEDESKLREAQSAIEAALSQTQGALTEWEGVGRELAARENTLAVAIARLEPADAAGVATLAVEKGQADLLSLWVARAPKLWRAVSELRSAVAAAAAPIRNAAQTRSVEEGLLAECTWVPGLDRPAELFGGVENYSRTLSATGENVLRDLRTVLAARRPAILSSAEIRSGFLRDGAIAVRQLDYDERAAGFART